MTYVTSVNTACVVPLTLLSVCSAYDTRTLRSISQPCLPYRLFIHCSLVWPRLLMLELPVQSSINKYKPGVIYKIAQFGVSRALPTADTKSCCLIRLVSELIVGGVLPLFCSDHASCTNDVISRAKYSVKSTGQQFGCPPTGIHGSPSRQGVRGGDKLRQIDVQFLHPLLHPSHSTYSTVFLSIHPWPPLVNVVLWVMEWLYSVLKQLRSWIQTEYMQPRVLNVNELAFLQLGAELSCT